MRTPSHSRQAPFYTAQLWTPRLSAHACGVNASGTTGARSARPRGTDRRSGGAEPSIPDRPPSRGSPPYGPRACPTTRAAGSARPSRRSGAARAADARAPPRSAAPRARRPPRSAPLRRASRRGSRARGSAPLLEDRLEHGLAGLVDGELALAAVLAAHELELARGEALGP